jgi:Rrf2 family transcriptional regulator, nitric oxide-sensitive transcriptional repressor
LHIAGALGFGYHLDNYIQKKAKKMFSQTSEYALRVVVYLASLKGKPATIPQIAEGTKAPEGYLAKVIKSLSRAEVIHSQRGKHGGSVLARPASQISVYEVIQAVDPIKRIKICPLGVTSHGVNLCALHRRLDDSIRMVEDTLRDSPISDLVRESGGSPPLCEIGAAKEVVKRR